MCNLFQALPKSRIPVMLNKQSPVSYKKLSSLIIERSNHSDNITPQFSIRKVERVQSKGKRPDRRKHSDDFEVCYYHLRSLFILWRHLDLISYKSQVRREANNMNNTLLSSQSMEHVRSDLLYCVRDSNELLHAKMVCDFYLLL